MFYKKLWFRIAEGVGLYIKNSISFVASQNISTDMHSVENPWNKMENKNKKIFVGVIYRWCTDISSSDI